MVTEQQVGLKFAICLLAGGAGSRMGGGKPHRQLHGRPLISYAHDNACRAGAPTWLALRDGADAMALNVALGVNLPVVIDAPDIPGPLGAVVAALRAARRLNLDAIVTLPCDAPLLPHDIVSRLIVALAHADAAIVRAGSQSHPVCAGWRITALAAVEREIAAGRLSLLGAARAADAATVDWPDVNAFININTVEELAAASTMIGQKRKAQSGPPAAVAAQPIGRRINKSAPANAACAADS